MNDKKDVKGENCIQKKRSCMIKRVLIICFSILITTTGWSQIMVPFVKRYGVTQRGELVMVSNSILTCNGGASCTSAENEVPPSGTSDNNGFNSAYIDIDGDPTTWSSSSANLNLSTCSKVTFAGLYWGASVTIGETNYAQRDSVKIMLPGSASYTALAADTSFDLNNGYDYYSCFKDITSMVAAGGNGTYTIADVVATIGQSNKWAGWSIVVVYKNDLLPEKNITVFDGLGYVSNPGNPMTATVNGFYTPPAGAVNFELGEIAYDGDRGLTGDSLLFNGNGSFVPVSDALHVADNMFNSTISDTAVQVLTRNPAYQNTLGYDANIFKPNNATKNYLANGATSAQIKIETNGDQIWLRVVTAVIATYEPELAMQKTVADINGGTVQPGDTLLYTVLAQNSGNDTSVATIITDTIPFNSDYVPGSIIITSGANAGAKTDAIGDDQADFITSAGYQIIKIRLGNGANSSSGGNIPHVGVNSTTFTFKTRITDDCTKLLCSPAVSNRANIAYSGFISGLSRTGLSNPLLFDSLGCPVEGYTSTVVQVPVTCAAPPDSSIGGCIPLVFSSVPGIRPGYVYYNSAWASVTQANSIGTYHGIRTITGTSCADTINYTVYVASATSANAGPNQDLCNVTGTTMAGNTPFIGTGTWSKVSGPNSPTFTSVHSPTTNVTGMIPGTYLFRWVISTGCDSTADTVTVVNSALPTTANAGPDQSLCNVTAATLAGNAPATGSGNWILVSGTNTPTITTPSNPNTTVTGMIAGVYTFRWAITSGVCASSSNDVQITIYALPTAANAGSDQSLCNVTTVSLTGNAPASGTGNWALVSGPNSPAITSPGSSSTNVTGMIPGIYTFSWTITNGVCSASTDSVHITIYAPSTISNAGPDQSLCNVTSTTLAGNTPVSGTGNWTLVSGPNSPTITTPTSPTSTVTGMIAGVYIFRWTITNGVCAASTNDIRVTIYALPTVSNAGPNQSLCNVTTTTFAGNIPATGTGTWTLVSGPNTPTITTPGSATSTVTGMIAGVYDFRWTISNGACAASSNDVQITIYALPTISNAGPDQSLCNVTSTTLAGNTPVTGTGAWTFMSGPNSPTITTPSNPGSTVTGMIAGVYVFQWAITSGVCASSVDSVKITIYALPTTANAGPDQNLCNVTTATFAGNTPVRGTGNWTLVSGPNTPTITTSSSPTSTITGMIAGVYIFRWTITSGVCAGSSDNVQITIYATSTISNAGPDQSLCNVTSATFGGNTPSAGSGIWALVSGPNTPTITVPSSPNSTVTGMIPGIYTFTWTITDGVCSASTDSVHITIYAPSTISNAGPDQSLCNVTSTTLAGNTPASGMGNWTLVSGPNSPTITTPASPTSTVTGMIAGVYIFRWTITDGVCAASTNDVQVTIYALPTVSNAGPDQSLCNVTSATFTGNTPVTGAGTWTLVSGPNTPTITTPASPASTVTGMIAGVYDFRWTISNGACAASSNDMQITIYTLPTISNAGPDQSLCNVTSTTLAGNTPATGTGAWTFMSGPNSPTITTPSNPGSTVTGMIAGVYVFQWAITSGVCASSVDSVKITIYALPTTANAGPDQNLCNVTTTTFAGNTPVTGTGNWMLVSGPNTPTITTSSSPTSTVTGMIPGVYIFKWTITSGVCATSSDNVQITIYATGTVSNAGPDQSLCNVTSTTLAGNAPGIGTGVWTLISGPNSPAITTPSSPASTVTGMIPGIYVFVWTITNGVCSPSTDSVHVTIYAPSTISNAGTDQSLCNVTSATLAGNVPAAGSGVWTLVSGPNAPTITTPSSPTSTVTGMIAGVYIFQWTITNGVCASSSDSVQITIYALPTVSNAGPDQSLCNMTSTTFASNSPSVGTGAWSFISGPNLPIITTPSNPASTVTGMVTGVYIFRWTITNGVCASSSNDVQITIYALPTISNAGPDQSLCNVTSTTLAGNTPVTGSGVWSLASGPNSPTITTPSNPGSTVTGMIAGVYVFQWAITSGVCASSVDSIKITIYALPTVANAGPDQNLCNVTSTTFAGNTPVTGGGTWTLASGPNTPAITTPSNPTSTVTGMTAGVYIFTWTIANGVCAVSTDSVQITIYNLPTVSSTGPDQNLCNVTSTILTGNTPSTGTGTWTLISGPNSPSITTPDSSTTSVTGMIAGTYTFRWTITNGVCSASTDSVHVTIYSLPATVDAGPDQNLCNVTSTTMAGNVPGIGTGTWTVISGPNAPSITSPNNPFTGITGMIAGVYQFGWTISNGVCVSPTDTVQVTIYALPSVSNAGADQNLCDVTSTSLTANTPIVGNGTWSFISGPNVPAITDSTNPNTSVTNMTIGTYIFTWTISSGVCTSSIDSVQITIYNLPTVVNAGPDQNLCNTDSAIMAANVPGVGTGNWALLSGPNTPVITSPNNPATSITGMIAGAYLFGWSISNGVCLSKTDTVQIVIYDLPTVADAGPDQSLCNVESALMAANPATTGSGLWSLVSGPNISVISDSASENTTITTMIAGTYVFAWTISNGVCTATSDTVDITIYALPTIANAGGDQSLCNIDSVVMAGNAPSVGGGKWAMVSGPNTPVITDSTNATTSVTGLIPGTYIFTWTITNGVCASSVDSVQITEYALPTVSSAGPDQNLCNLSTTTFAGNAPSAGSGIWTLISGPNTPVIAVPSDSVSPVSGLIAGTYIFTWAISNGVCAVSTDTLQINVYDLPTVSDAGPDQNLCSDTVITLAGNMPTTGTGLWTLIRGPNTPGIDSISNPNTMVHGLIPGTYVFNWAITNGTCSVSNDSVQVTIYQFPPVIDAGPDQSLCNVTSVLLSGNVPNVGTGVWTFISGPNTPVINSPGNPATNVNGMVAGTYLFAWNITNGVCSPFGDTVQITIYDLPTVADAGPDQSLCNTSTATLSGDSATTGSGVWTLVSGPNTPLITDSAISSTTVTGMVPGTYLFSWTISNGVCSSTTDTVQITIYAAPLSVDAGPDQILCNVDSVVMAGNAPSSGTGIWTLVSGPNSPVITSPNDSATSVTGMIPGIYVFGWTINNGVCSTPTDTMQVTIYALPTISNAGIDQSLCNDSTAALTGNTPAAGTGTWSQLSGPNTPTIVSPGSAVTDVNGLVPGTYSFSWTISNGVCASSMDTVQLTMYGLPDVSDAGPDQALCNVDSVTMAGNAPSVGTGLWTLISGPNAPTITSTANPTTTVTGMIAGVYQFSWTVSNGVCSSTTDTVQITIYALPTVANAGADQNLCNVTTVTLSGDIAVSGTGIWTQINGPNTPTIAPVGNANTTVTGMVAGVYEFSWTISNGVCSSTTDTVQITIYDLPTVADAGPDQSLCNTSTATLSGDSATTGSGVWTLVSGPNTPLITDSAISSTTVTGMVPGTYLFSWTISNGVCSSTTDTVQITIYAAPLSVDAGPDQILCNVDSVVMAGNAPSSGIGIWTLISGPNNPIITSPNDSATSVTGMIPGIYVFGWTINNGVCSTPTDTMQATIYALPTISNAGIDQSLCNDSIATLTGNTPVAGTGIWTQVNGPNTPTIVSPGSAVTDVNGLVPGTYSFSWTISNGVCASSTDTVQLTMYGLPDVSDAGPDQAICNIDSVTMAGNAPAVGTGLWTLISGPNSPAITAPANPNTTVTGMIAGVYQFSWTVSNGVCSSTTDTVQITIYDLPTVANAGADQSLCNVTAVTLSGDTAVTGTGIWTQINGSNTPVITSTGNQNTTVIGMMAGVYEFSWTISNGVCSSTTDTVQITIYDLPTVANAGVDQNICDTSLITLHGNDVLTGTGIWTLVSGPNLPLINSTGSPVTIVTNIVPGVYLFQWTISNGVCASSIDTVQITINPNPTVANAGTNQRLCSVSSAMLNGNTPVVGNELWLFVSGPNIPIITSPDSAQTNVTGMIPGTYIFRWTIGNGVCSPTSNDVEVTIYAMPQANAGSDQSLCTVSSALLQGNNPSFGTGSWAFLDGPNVPTIISPSSDTTSVTGLIQGIYIFQWSVTNGVCSQYAQVQVTINPPPAVTVATHLFTTCSGESEFTLNASGAVSYSWSPARYLSNPSIADPVVTVYNTITYFVTGTDSNGGTASDSVIIEICDTLIIPDAFSPNGDGVNDYFVIVGIERYPDNNLQFFNRWGNLLYEKRNYDNTWDAVPNVKGFLAGSGKVPSGTYFYILELGNGEKGRSGYVVIKY